MPLSPALRNRAPLLAGVCALALIVLALARLSVEGAFLFTLGILLAFALLRAPEIAIYLLILAVPFGSLFPFPIGGANATFSDALVLLALSLWVVRSIARGRVTPRIPPLSFPFILFILAISISLLVAQSLTEGAKEILKWIEMFAVYWLVAQEFEDKQRERALAVTFVAGFAQAVIGANQYYFRAGPEGFLLFGGTNLRAFGTFEQPNPFAGYLGLIIPLAFGTALGVLFEHARSATHKALFALAMVSLGAMLAALFFSYSRGAWVGVAAALVVTFLIRSKRAAVLGFALAALIAIVALLGQFNILPDVISERFATVNDYFGFEDVRGVNANDDNFAIVERRAHWQAALGMFSDHPWLGVGIGNYAVAYPAYALPHWDDPLGHAHNYYLNVLAEAGLLGLTAYLFLWGAVFWNVWRTVRRTFGFWQAVVAGAFGMLVALSIHNFFDNLFVHSMYIQVGITLGIVESLTQNRQA